MYLWRLCTTVSFLFAYAKIFLETSRRNYVFIFLFKTEFRLKKQEVMGSIIRKAKAVFFSYKKYLSFPVDESESLFELFPSQPDG